MLQPTFPPLPQQISYTDSILLTGSCFTEHIHDRLAQHKFSVLGNPHGILFNPMSVASALDSYIADRQYEADDLFYLNDLWNSWDHHTRFSHPDKQQALAQMNEAQKGAARFIQRAGFVIITLGSAFQYYLKENNRPVANNHRAPAQWFDKRLLEVPHITDILSATLEQLFHARPEVQVLFTISPVRHIRDGVIDNNRSKARLLEAVHTLCSKYEHVHYFPAYELVIDVLRDYRFYDIDMVHPNYAATSFVWQQFADLCLSPETKPVMKEVSDITTARNHRPRFPHTAAHQQFMASYAARIKSLAITYPFLDFTDDLTYFCDHPKKI